jgi:thiosulfate reductase cytochrome b subunit
MNEGEDNGNPMPPDSVPAAEAENAGAPAGQANPREPIALPVAKSINQPAAVKPFALNAPPQVTVADQVEEAVTPVLPRIRLDKKHPLAIRWMHWVNFPVLFTMIWSGLLIYWNDSDNAYHHPHAVYRVGVGPVTLVRFFPEWFWKAMNAPYHVTQGLGYHFFFLWIFAINGLAYVLFTIFSGEWRFIVPDRNSLKEGIQVTLKDLHLSNYLPPQKKYNGAQKIAYTSVILMGAGSLITGLAIYKPTQAHWVTTLLGGYEMARWEHFLLTIGFCGFFLVHVTQVVLAGWNNFRSMVSGLEVQPVQEQSSGFPVEIGGAGKVHAAFREESRTRGRWRIPRSRKSGSLDEERKSWG